MKGDQIFDIAKVKDILDTKQVKNVDVKASSKQAQSKARQDMKDIAKKNGADESKVDDTLNIANEKIKNELITVLQSLGIKNPMP